MKFFVTIAAILVSFVSMSEAKAEDCYQQCVEPQLLLLVPIGQPVKVEIIQREKARPVIQLSVHEVGTIYAWEVEVPIAFNMSDAAIDQRRGMPFHRLLEYVDPSAYEISLAKVGSYLYQLKLKAEWKRVETTHLVIPGGSGRPVNPLASIADEIKFEENSNSCNCDEWYDSVKKNFTNISLDNLNVSTFAYMTAIEADFNRK